MVPFAVGDTVAVVVNELPTLSSIPRKWQTGMIAGLLSDDSKDVMVKFCAYGKYERAVEIPVEALTHDVTPPQEYRNPNSGRFKPFGEISKHAIAKLET